MIKNLWQLLKGERCRVTGFKADINEAYRTRLLELGFLPNALVTCLLSPKLGAPKLYQVNNIIYSLDDRMASLIDVQVNA